MRADDIFDAIGKAGEKYAADAALPVKRKTPVLKIAAVRDALSGTIAKGGQRDPKTDVRENALSDINDKMLNSVLNKRHKKTEKEETNNFPNETKRKSFFSGKAIAVAAVLAVMVCGLAVIIPLSTRSPGAAHDPQYVPNFSAPELEEIYGTEPYSELLPKRLLPNCSFEKSYLTEYDPVANPEAHKFLGLTFKTGDELWEAMEINVSEYDGLAVFADINDKKTYALSYLYGDNSDTTEKDPDLFSGLFHAEDITFDITKEMVYTLPDGLCKAEVSLLCGDHIVSYAYTGDEITPEAFYDMIISSDWFSR